MGPIAKANPKDRAKVNGNSNEATRQPAEAGKQPVDLVF
jgi:hypothetical protein